MPSYTILYLVSCGKAVLCCESTPITQPLEFSTLEVPNELRGKPLECRFIIFDERGNYVDSACDYCAADPAILRSALNILPLRFIGERLDLLGAH